MLREFHKVIVTGSLKRFACQIVLIVLPLVLTCCGIACQKTVEPKAPQSKSETQLRNSDSSSNTVQNKNQLAAPSNTVALKESDAAEYLGRQACTNCHAEISTAYNTHPMSRSMVKAVEVPVIEPGQPVKFDPPGPCRYEIERDDHRMTQTEEFVDLSGEVVYRDTVPVDYAVGSGQRGYSFITDHHGPMTLGVATWYSTKSVWDLSPGYKPPSHPRFGRRVADGCVACHAGRTNSISGEPNRFQSHPFAELSIGCERCHGPGKQHVEFHSLATKPQTPDPIVNPASLDFSQQLSICYQCHLHGEERVVRSGRSEYDFRPGEHLSDVWVAFVNGSGIQGDGSTTAVSQVEQMHESRCFIASAGRMTCTSCHDPHQSPTPQDRVEYYRRQCLACHNKTDDDCRMPKSGRLQQVADDSCIQCHMPAVNAGDVPHTAQTDHRVLRMPSAVKPTPASNVPQIFEPSLFPIPEVEQRRARGILMANMAENRQDFSAATTAIVLLDSIAKENRTDIPVLDALATCLQMTGDREYANTLFTEAVKLSPRNEHVLRSLVMTSINRRNYIDALRYLDRVEALYPNDGTVLLQRSLILNQLSRKSEAYDAATKAVQLLPNDFNIRANQIRLANELGMKEQAEEQEAILDRMQRAMKTAFPELKSLPSDGK